jgi:hypothetical protein
MQFALVAAAVLMAEHAEAACTAKADGDVDENADEAAMDACATTDKCLGILRVTRQSPPLLRRPPVPILSRGTPSASAGVRSG